MKKKEKKVENKKEVRKKRQKDNIINAKKENERRRNRKYEKWSRSEKKRCIKMYGSRPFLRWVWSQDCSPHVSGITKNTFGPVGIPFI